MRLCLGDLWLRAMMAKRLQVLHSADLDDAEARALAYGDLGEPQDKVQALDADAARVEKLRRQNAAQEIGT